MLAIWSLVPLPLLNPAWTSGSSRFTYCWSLAWRILSIILLAYERNIWAFFGIAFLCDWNENWPFPVLCHSWVFQICWHIEYSAFTTSSSRIWNSSAGIPSPPLALFVVMLPNAHLTSHPRMSGSRWVITPSWLSGSWRSFLYSSSVYSSHLFLTSSASVRSIPFLSFVVPIFSWNVPLVSLIFLKSSLVFPILLFSSICLKQQFDEKCSKFLKPDLNIMWTVNFQMFKLDLKRQRNQTSNCQHPLDDWKIKRVPENIYFCFIDYAKAFDCVDHNKVWKILKEMGLSDHLTCLWRNLYAGQEATVRPGDGTKTDSK